MKESPFLPTSIARFLAGVLLTALLFSPASGHAQDLAKKPLLWGADAEGGAPYVFQDAEHPDQMIGFEAEIAAALAKELGRPITFKQYDFKNLLLGLERGDFDFAMNGLEITPDRQAQVRFSRPYYVYRLRLVVRAGEDRIRGLADCRKPGLKVGTLENTAASRLLDSMGITKVVYDSQVTPYQDLEIGRIDAVLMDLPIAQYYGKSAALKNAEDPIGGRGYYAIAFKKENAALAAEIDQAIERLLKAGELRRIYQKWGLWNDSEDELLPPNQFYAEQDAGATNETRPREAWTFGNYFPLLLQGALLTVELTFASMLLAVIVGLPIALARMYGGPWLRLLAVLYVEFFRGVPLLLLLYLLYYALPAVSHAIGLGNALDLGAVAAAVLGLGLNYAAYEAEIYRAGISSVPEGQWEAGASLGMTSGLTFRRIILPQAIRLILPPTTGDFVALFKDTSIVSGITLVELSKSYQILSTSGADYSQIAQIGAVTATLYLAMSVPLGHLSRYLERRWQ
jgi:polar amino acid transport system substrate-binding protein